MTDARIPTLSSLAEVYPVGRASIESARWQHLTDRFAKRFGHPATHICRAPGRVNLIGEHIDYALFGVFPAAVDRDILIACAPRSDSSEIRSQNLDESKYTGQTFTANRINDVTDDDKDAWFLDIDKGSLRWESYVKAGYFGVLNRFFRSSDTEPTGLDMLVDGTIPSGSGLSSSAAMVVASTLTFLTMNNKLGQLSKGDLVHMAVENEKRVGVNSGGMDQAASILSLPHHALYISFYPKLAPTQISLVSTNPTTCFVIANSVKVSDKLVNAKVQYNLRVIETLVGARVLARGLGVEIGLKEKITFREVLSRWSRETQGSDTEDVKALEVALERIIPEVERVLGVGNGKGGLTLDEMIEATGLSNSSLNDIYFSWVEVEATYFQLYKRAKHVYTEALRVLKFRKHSLSSSSEDSHEELGHLMDESHASCRDLFECSCPELDELVVLAKRAGAWGSRLTGAGWGGCTVSLVTESQVPTFIANIRRAYAPYKALDDIKLRDVIFSTKPGGGAGVFSLDEWENFFDVS